MSELDDTPLTDLVTALNEADEKITEGLTEIEGGRVKVLQSQAVLRVVVPEVLKRLIAIDVPLPPDDDVPPDPPEPPNNGGVVVINTGGNPQSFDSALDRIDINRFDDVPSIYVEEGMTEQEVAAAVNPVLYANGGVAQIVVSGKIGSLYIGGSHAQAIHNDGEPIVALHVVGHGSGAEVGAIKFATNRGGVDGEVRLENIDVTPKADGNGNGIGDKAPIATLDSMYSMHLVLLNVGTKSPLGWTAYDGMGAKWAVFLSGCRLTVMDLVADPVREHTFYIKNMRDAFVERARNTTRLFTDAAGDVHLIGNGRTFEQHSNRVPDVYPKGGKFSEGDIVFKDCEAHACGWEGMLATEKWEYAEVPLLDPVTGEQVIFESSVGPVPQTHMVKELVGINPGGKPSGGSDYTNHSHTGGGWYLFNCQSIQPNCGGVAAWNEISHKKKSTENPNGNRSWLIGANGEILNPYEVDSGGDGHGTNLVVIEGYRMEGRGNRTPMLLSGTKELHVDGALLDGAPMELGVDIKLDHQAGASLIETATVNA